MPENTSWFGDSFFFRITESILSIAIQKSTKSFYTFSVDILFEPWHPSITMERKVYVEAKVKLVLRLNEGIEVGDAMSAIQVQSDADSVMVEDFEVLDHEVTDSK